MNKFDDFAIDPAEINPWERKRRERRLRSERRMTLATLLIVIAFVAALIYTWS